MKLISRLFKKNREETLFRVFDNAELFREKQHTIIDDLNADVVLEGGLLFDASQFSHHLAGGIIVPFPSADTQWGNTNHFDIWFHRFFQRDKSEKVIVLLEIESGLEKLFQDYADHLSSREEISKDRKRELIGLWEKRTRVLIWELFCNYYLESSGGDYRDSRDIIKRSLWAISRRKEDILYPQKRFDSYNVLLYNLWGEEYNRRRAELQKNVVGLSVEQKALLYSDENKEVFNLLFSNNYEAAICVCGKPQAHYLSAELEAIVYLESLFNDYIKRLRRAGIYDEMQTKMAVKQWRDVTVSEIDRLAIIDEVSTVMFSQSSVLAPDFRDALVTKVEYDKICHLRSFADKCRSAISGFVDDYLTLIDEGYLVKSWSERLLAARINYRGLYSDMIDKKIIDPCFEYVAFEDAFRSADFSHLIESARYMDSIKPESGRPGLIQLLVNVVGNRVGDDWYYTAAESIYPKYTGKDAKFAVEKLRPTKFIKKYAPQILEGRIPEYKY